MNRLSGLFACRILVQYARYAAFRLTRQMILKRASSAMRLMLYINTAGKRILRSGRKISRRNVRNKGETPRPSDFQAASCFYNKLPLKWQFLTKTSK